MRSVAWEVFRNRFSAIDNTGKRIGGLGGIQIVRVWNTMHNPVESLSDIWQTHRPEGVFTKATPRRLI